MEIVDVIEKLKGYNRLKIQIKKLSLKKEILAEDIVELPALACSEKIQSSNTRKVVEENTLKLIQEKNLIEKKIHKKESEIKMIEAGLNELPYYEKKVLEMRYIYKTSWREIEEELGYTERHLQNIKNKALNDLKVFFEL